MTYSRPKPTPIETTQLCKYGCGQQAKYQFSKGSYSCSEHHNSCPEKRKAFSERDDHKGRGQKSLETRTRLGITKTAQIKGGATRRQMGFYVRLGKRMQEILSDRNWSRDPKSKILSYKDTSILYQGQYEFEFLQSLEESNGLEWLVANVSRGPTLWYNNPIDNKQHLYISDFIIDGVIHEIKSSWTWNKNGTDMDLERRNKAKLDACVNAGYAVVLVIWKKETIRYEKRSLGGAL